MGTTTDRLSAAQTVTTDKPSLLDEIVQQQAAKRAEVADRYRPVLSIDEMIEREKALSYLVDNVMREGIDYGWVPGTKPTDSKPGEYQAKPTLFKAGAERACAFFGYAPHFERMQVIEEWTTEKYGEMLFFYEYRCVLSKDGKPVGEGIGSGTTFESKYRYRNASRVCPNCGKDSIIRGKAEYGGGWLCFAKKGGCGTKFAEGDPTIEGQDVGRVANPDVADVVNTVSKMAQKRSYVAATLTATGLSGRFVADLDDMSSVPGQETVDQVRDRRMSEERANAARQQQARQQGSPPQHDDPPPQQQRQQQQQRPVNQPAPTDPVDIAVAEFRRADKFGRMEMFGNLKKQFVAILNTEGEPKYYDHLAAVGVQHCDKFGTLGDAVRCFRAMVEDLRNQTAAMADPELRAE